MSVLSAHDAAVCLAYLGATLGVAMVVPQIVRTVRHPDLAGVSPASWGLTALGCLSWLTYGVRTATIPQIPGNVLLVTGSIAIVLLVPSHLSRSRRALMLAAAMIVVALVAFRVPVETAGFLAFGISLFSAWPQVLTTLRGSREAAGVSLTTFTLRLAAGLGWLAYAVIAHDVPVIFSAGVMTGTTLLVLAVESSRRTESVLEDIPILEPA